MRIEKREARVEGLRLPEHIRSGGVKCMVFMFPCRGSIDDVEAGSCARSLRYTSGESF